MTLMSLVVRAPFALIDGDLRPAAVAVAGDVIVDIAAFNDEFDAASDITLNDTEVLVLADAVSATGGAARRGIRVGARADLVAWGRSALDVDATTRAVTTENLAVPAT
ncbi:hypothetical protein [Demequina flava]|uniref:hypothetical protein n=1 Tax=Demequina flava TaxID=1095025 RepID=UPI0007830996|nr:hypothetical protein [Demequina flava]